LLADDDLIRIEIFSDSGTERFFAFEGEPLLRRKILDEVAYRWGVLGNGSALVCREMQTVAQPQESRKPS
jgi:hypothetical protein